MLQILSSVVIAIGMIWLPNPASASSGADAIRYLPVQDSGRVKPFDTFARESMQLIYGSETYKTASNERREAIEVVMTWMLLPKYWDEQKFIEVNHKGLKDSLKVDQDQRYFSPIELLQNPRLTLVMQDLASRTATKQKLDPFYQAASRLENQIGLYEAIKSGSAMRVAPPPATFSPSAGGPHLASEENGEESRWLAVGDLHGDLQDKFSLVIRSLIHALPSEDGAAHVDASDGLPSLSKAVDDFKAAARMTNPDAYPNERDISIEVHERQLHPFMIAWGLYLLAAIILAFAWHYDKRNLYIGGWTFAIAAFLMHSYGFGLRMYLTGRPPVSNMYESVVWVSFGAVVFSMIFEFLTRRKYVLIAGCTVGVLCLIVANAAPTILDSSLQPLEPVLRSNYWLTIHVLTITLSYSAYFLAWCLGNLGLGMLLRGHSGSDERVRQLVQSIYRAIQVGVVLLASGIILGGIWADYSWGRFWGWDPKETWALIALLGYLAVLHGRLVGWVQNVGLMVASVLAFNLVIMAWYGVNYVLGAGLHSYGFGAGGVQYVMAFVALDLTYVGYCYYILKARTSVGA